MKKVTRLKHNQLTTYGIGQDISAKAWQVIFRQIVALGLLEVKADQFNILKITPKGRQFLKEKYPISVCPKSNNLGNNIDF